MKRLIIKICLLLVFTIFILSCDLEEEPLQPFISDISPTEFLQADGDVETLTISGINFGNNPSAVTVSLDDVNLEVNEVNNNLIEADVTFSNTSGDVIVTIDGNSATYSKSITITKGQRFGNFKFATVTNPETEKTWMDRNLGASRVATSIIDEEAFGDLYQWGRPADGHEKRTSATIPTLATSDTPGHGDFILNAGNAGDWRTPPNNNLWQGVDGVNNPCPSGFRLPTENEWVEEAQSWDNFTIAGAFESILKLPAASGRSPIDGNLSNVAEGYYWSSDFSSTDETLSLYIAIFSSGANIFIVNRAWGMSVRCIQD